MILNWADYKAATRPIDVCIVGGGAVGLTMADALRGAGLTVLVLEAGGTRATRAAQDFYRGELADPTQHPWPHHFRVRAVGGASRIWGGRCLPFDPIDFESRPWAPGPGWPIAFSDLAPYYPRAQAAAEAGPYDYDPTTALSGQQAALAPGLDGETIITSLERFSRPTNFWRRFKDGLAKDADVHLLMDAPVLSIRLEPQAQAVESVELASPDGERARLRAKHYVLAAGGLETVRLLLASNDVMTCGIGGASGHLGRYYMSHLAATAGRVVFNHPKDIAFDYARDAAGTYVRRRLSLTPQAQRQNQSLNIAFRTHLPNPADPAHRDPVLSAMYLVKDLVLFEYSRKLREQGRSARRRLAHLANIARDPLALAAFSRRWIARRLLADRKLPSVVMGAADGVYPLEFHAEQSPNPDSRLTLSDQRDRLGLRRLRIDWRLSDLDVESVQRAYGLLARELERAGVGGLAYDPADVAARARAEGAYGGHHIGAARMSASPADGVVDADCRVHGVTNLHVASAAVFPTSGQANPTLTLLALGLRLADRLKQQEPWG